MTCILTLFSQNGLLSAKNELDCSDTMADFFSCKIYNCKKPRSKVHENNRKEIALHVVKIHFQLLLSVFVRYVATHTKIISPKLS